MGLRAYVEQTALETAVVNIDACRRLAALLKSYTIPVDHENSSLPGLKAAQVGNFYLLLVAICHQTSPKHKPPLEGVIGGRYLRGWDFLSAKLEIHSQAHPEILSPKVWTVIIPEQLQSGMPCSPVQVLR